MSELRNWWLYEFHDGHEIVFYGISCNPIRREPEHSGKRFSYMNVISVGLTRSEADNKQLDEIQRYQYQHGGIPPKYNGQLKS